MTTRLICDTSVFRNIGAGDLDLARLGPAGSRLYYSPTTVFELASKYAEGSFLHRKAAAQAILDTTAVILPDPETYLTRDVFGLELSEPPFDWSQAVLAMAQASSLAELESGVADYSARVVRRIAVGRANQYRVGVDEEFVDEMVALQKSEIEGFDEWFATDASVRGNPPKMKGLRKTCFIRDARSPSATRSVELACRARAQFNAAEIAVPVPAQWPEVSAKLAFYVGVYKEYMIRLMTAGVLARPNDFFDLDIMMFSCSDEDTVCTSEPKWASLAKAAGFPQRVVRFI